MSDLVGNPEDRFSRVAAHISLIMFAIKDALLVQCESVLQMLGANKMPPF